MLLSWEIPLYTLCDNTYTHNHPHILIFSLIDYSSRARYWFLLLLTLLLNVAVLTLYKVDPNQRSIPTKPFIGINGFQENPALFYTLGGLHILLSLWMVLEYFTVTCTHFVLPEFLYNIRLIPRSFGNYKLTAWLTRWNKLWPVAII